MKNSAIFSPKLLNRFIFILAIAGILMAAYVSQSFLRQSSILCVNSGCELVRKNPASYIFGIPVPVFGLIGYTGIAILSFLRTTTSSPILLRGIVGMATFGVLFVSWFTFTEITVIKAVCTWCAISAIAMGLIFSCSIISLRKERKPSV